MSDDKWKWTEPDSRAQEAKERGGMTFLLILGAILTIGGIFFVWKIGAFDLEYFWGLDHHELRYRHKNLVEFTMFFHAPYIIGIAMMGAALRYFRNHRKRK